MAINALELRSMRWPEQAVDGWLEPLAMDTARAVCSSASGLRKANKLRNRLPLSDLTVVVPHAARLADFGAIIADMQRVFPADKLALTKKERDDGRQSPFRIIDGKPFLDGVDGSFTPYNPEDRSMASCATFAQAVVAKYGYKELRGERALWLDIAEKMVIRARQHAEEKQAALEAAKAE